MLKFFSNLQSVKSQTCQGISAFGRPISVKHFKTASLWPLRYASIFSCNRGVPTVFKTRALRRRIVVCLRLVASACHTPCFGRYRCEKMIINHFFLLTRYDHLFQHRWNIASIFGCYRGVSTVFKTRALRRRIVVCLRLVASACHTPCLGRYRCEKMILNHFFLLTRYDHLISAVLK